MFQKFVILFFVFSLLLAACSNPLQGLSPAPWEPVAGDADLSRGEVFLTEKEIQVETSDPAQYLLFLSGTLPTPCHQLRLTVSEPDEKNQINVEAYSVFDPSEVCIQVLESFEENIPLGSFSSGSQITYTVFVNGQSVGQFVP